MNPKFVPMSVELLEVMGSDLTVANSARVSLDKHHDAFLLSDAKLIKYLAENNHWSPFAHAQLQFRCKAPMYVARQLQKHQIGLVWNEMSRRYVDKEPEFFRQEFRIRQEGVKQGSGELLVPNLDTSIENTTKDALNAYNYLLDMNVAPECARAVLPMNTMTEWYWTGSLYAFARVVKQRYYNSHAQSETRDFTGEIRKYLDLKFPYSSDALLRA